MFSTPMLVRTHVQAAFIAIPMTYAKPALRLAKHEQIYQPALFAPTVIFYTQGRARTRAQATIIAIPMIYAKPAM